VYVSVFNRTAVGVVQLILVGKVDHVEEIKSLR
jgi:hypothetical protein